MPVLDASAIVAILGDEPGRSAVEDLLHHPVDVVFVSGLNIAEVIDVVGRRIGDTDIVERQVELLLHGGLEIVVVDETVGIRAGVLRARHYDAKTRNLSMGDCVALATSQLLDEQLVTSDWILAKTAADEAIAVIRIPNSAGVVD